jgi:hypothetical protein
MQLRDDALRRDAADGADPRLGKPEIAIRSRGDRDRQRAGRDAVAELGDDAGGRIRPMPSPSTSVNQTLPSRAAAKPWTRAPAVMPSVKRVTSSAARAPPPAGKRRAATATRDLLEKSRNMVRSPFPCTVQRFSTARMRAKWW